MNKLCLSSTMLALSAVFIMTTAHAAEFDGAATLSQGKYQIALGESNIGFGPHKKGLAGIGTSYFPVFGRLVRADFQGLANNAIKQILDTGIVWTINEDPKTEKTAHKVGHFSFTRVGDMDVWTGEWSSDGAPNWESHQVFYYGDITGTTVPKRGIASYTVIGINRFTSKSPNPLSGEFVVNFAKGTVNGFLAREGMKMVLDDVSFKHGSPDFNGYANVGNFTGVVQGRFYGKNAAGLAGFAKFDANRTLDTAFGGTKQ